MVREKAKARAAPARKPPSPRYHQVYITLRTWFRDGQYAPGAQIPTETELCKQFGVSRITVRKAIDDLVREGWLVRYQGRGTFVDMSNLRPAVSVNLHEAMDRVADLAAATQVRDAKVSMVPPDEETQAALRLGDGELVQRASHVRVLNGVPLGLITTFVPAFVADQVGRHKNVDHLPMFEQLERAGIELGEAEQWIGATLANLESAKALDTEVGAPLLKLKRVVFDTHGNAVERVVALYRADAYHYRMHLAAPRSAPSAGKRRRTNAN